ncbi:hypothetical protein C8R44DRAFT_873752 [Mycena epipterygia]|nr:hypothetical protein C8R44DRAFT_873752 [Mycena epipterygia]
MVIPASTPPFLSTIPAGPIFTATWSANCSTTPAAADTSLSGSDTGTTAATAAVSGVSMHKLSADKTVAGSSRPFLGDDGSLPSAASSSLSSPSSAILTTIASPPSHRPLLFPSSLSSVSLIHHPPNSLVVHPHALSCSSHAMMAPSVPTHRRHLPTSHIFSLYCMSYRVASPPLRSRLLRVLFGCPSTLLFRSSHFIARVPSLPLLSFPHSAPHPTPPSPSSVCASLPLPFTVVSSTGSSSPTSIRLILPLSPMCTSRDPASPSSTDNDDGEYLFVLQPETVFAYPGTPAPWVGFLVSNAAPSFLRALFLYPLSCVHLHPVPSVARSLFSREGSADERARRCRIRTVRGVLVSRSPPLSSLWRLPSLFIYPRPPLPLAFLVLSSPRSMIACLHLFPFPTTSAPSSLAVRVNPPPPPHPPPCPRPAPPSSPDEVFRAYAATHTTPASERDGHTRRYLAAGSRRADVFAAGFHGESSESERVKMTPRARGNARAAGRYLCERRSGL